ncbi:preprotein translocase subunit SecA, partial [candidate division CPR3 bacterium RIFOXYC2_FULL_35_7]
KQVKKLKPIVEKINSFEKELEKLKDSEIKDKTEKWQTELQKMDLEKQNSFLEEILPEAFALAREAGKRTLGLRAFDVQLIAGIILHQGKIAEQKTGEGKTLTAVFPLYLNSLTQRGCHLVTPNDYLSKIGCGWMGPIYDLLGISVSTIVHDQAFIYDAQYVDEKAQDSRLIHLRPITRQQAYQSHLTYGTNNEFGFDYLRDNMVWNLEQMVQSNMRKEWGIHHFAIVDEVDFILIDEARTPLIISAPEEDSTKRYYDFARLMKRLDAKTDFTTDEKTKNASLTEEGVAKLESLLKVDNLYEKDFQTLHHIEQALRADVMYQKDKDYIVKEGQVIIVDEFTGRLMEGRRYSEGLHQAIEAKEGVEIQKESKTLATISFQNYFRMYKKLSGMTGTAVTESEEFHKIYKLEVVVIPTNNQVIRQDQQDLIYKDEKSKFNAVIEEIKNKNKTGQPILVGTTSIAKNEFLSLLLERRGIKHSLLNAKHHEKEALILSAAGEKGAVTVATNMAGRGVDIELGGKKPDKYRLQDEEGENKKETDLLHTYEKELQEWQERHNEVVSLGGLYVIGTERHEARRIDNQLRGRSGRQGDPGESRFFVSLEDDIMRIFGGDQVKKIMSFLNMPDDIPLEHKMVSKALESAQTRVEGHNFDIRKQLVEYDDVMNKQREIIYGKRRKILEEGQVKDLEVKIEKSEEENLDFDNNESRTQNLKERILNMIKEEITAIVVSSQEESGLNHEKIIKEFIAMIPFNDQSQKVIQKELTAISLLEEIEAKLDKIATTAYENKEREIGEKVMREVEKFVSLSTIDNLWQIHLTDIDHLREGIGLRGYGQRDPLIEYKGEAFKMFEMLNGSIHHDIAGRIYKISIAQKATPKMKIQEKKPEVEEIAIRSGSKEISPARRVDMNRRNLEPIKTDHKIGRNDPCPCGSGKKYKKCFLLEGSGCKLQG